MSHSSAPEVPTRGESSDSFDAFLSYSSQNRRAAGRIHARLESYRPPRGVAAGRKRLRIFRYEHDQALHPSLHAALGERLDEVDHLVLAGSPSAAASQVVEFEAAVFLARREPDDVHLVLVDGEAAGAFPPTVRERMPDAVWADLRSASAPWLVWILRDRRRFRRASIPLLASLLEVDPDDLVRREARRRRLRWTAAAIPVVTAILALATLYLASPGKMWISFAQELPQPPQAVVVVGDSAAPKAVRALAWWSTNYEDSHFSYGAILETDLRGRRTGAFAYLLDYAEMNYWMSADQAPGFEESGSLADDLRPLTLSTAHGFTELALGNFRWPPPMSAGARRPLCDDGEEEDGSAVRCGHVTLSRPVASLDSMAEAAAGAQGVVNGNALANRCFGLRPNGILCFVHIYTGGAGTDGTVPLRSSDGRRWVPGKLVPDMDAGEISALTGAGRGLLHLGVGGDFATSNRVMRSADGGLTWTELPIPRWAEDGWSLHDLTVSVDDPRVVAVSLVRVVPAEAPVPARVVLTRDGGKHWGELATGAPREWYAQLGGVTAAGEVAALFHSGGSGAQRQGNTAIWRRLSALERIRGAIGGQVDRPRETADRSRS